MLKEACQCQNQCQSQCQNQYNQRVLFILVENSSAATQKHVHFILYMLQDNCKLTVFKFDWF